MCLIWGLGQAAVLRCAAMCPGGRLVPLYGLPPHDRPFAPLYKPSNQTRCALPDRLTRGLTPEDPPARRHCPRRPAPGCPARPGAGGLCGNTPGPLLGRQGVAGYTGPEPSGSLPAPPPQPPVLSPLQSLISLFSICTVQLRRSNY